MPISLEGLADVLRKLVGMETSVQRNTRIVMDEIAPQVQAFARSLAAVDTGYMRDHTLTRAIAGARIGFELYCEAYYSIFVELGHHTHSGSFVAARPFLTPAILYGRDLIMARLPSVLLDIGGL
jgi:hypothetical protein